MASSNFASHSFSWSQNWNSFEGPWLTITFCSSPIIVPSVGSKKFDFAEKSPGMNLLQLTFEFFTIPRTLKALATSSEQKNVLLSSINFLSFWSPLYYTVCRRFSFLTFKPYFWPSTSFINYSRLSTISLLLSKSMCL